MWDLNELLVWFVSLLRVQLYGLWMKREMGKFSISYHLETYWHGLSYHTGAAQGHPQILKMLLSVCSLSHLNSILKCRFLSRLCPNPYAQPQSWPAALMDGALHRPLPSSAHGLSLVSEQNVSDREFMLSKTPLNQEGKGVRVNTPVSYPWGGQF